MSDVSLAEHANAVLSSEHKDENFDLGFYVFIFVLKRMARNCTKINNACAEPLFCSLNLLYSLVAALFSLTDSCLV